MLIGKIYDKVFVLMSEETGSSDEVMNQKLLLLTAEADLEHMDEAKMMAEKNRGYGLVG